LGKYGFEGGEGALFEIDVWLFMRIKIFAGCVCEKIGGFR
jgi:hypothetical protein